MPRRTDHDTPRFDGRAPVRAGVHGAEACYGPLRARFDAFLERHGRSEAARALVDAEQSETAL
ncbi:MAG: hypothetical protein AAF957_21285 [Planctomycetota bacterium]